MRAASSLIFAIVVLGFTTPLSAQAKKSNGLGSMSARNAAAISGLAPKPNYNSPNPFKAPANNNMFAPQNTARGNNMFAQPQNTARGNISVRNPSTGKTQVFVPQNTASGNTVFKSPSSGATFNAQGTARGGTVLRGSNGTQTYIPPATNSTSSAKGANLQRFNEGKALYEQLHAQGRLPSQQPAAVQPSVMPTIDFGSLAEPTFSDPVFESESTVPSLVLQPQPVGQSSASGTLQSEPVFELPAAEATAGSGENVIPFQGGSVTIKNPESTRGAVKFTLDGTPVTLEAGMEVTVDSQPSYVIDFTRGGGQGKARYTLAAGTNYDFSVSSGGWELMSALAPVEAVPFEVETPVPSAEPKLSQDSSQVMPVIEFPTDPQSGKIVIDDEFLKLIETPQLNNSSIGFQSVPQIATLQEIVKGSRIVVTTDKAKLYDGAKVLATLKQFQSYTALDVTNTHVLIEHNGKKAWLLKSDCILGDTGGF